MALNSEIDEIAALQSSAVAMIRDVEVLNRDLRKLLGAGIMATTSSKRAEHDSAAVSTANEIHTKIKSISQLLVKISNYSNYPSEETKVLATQVHSAVNVQYVDVLRAFFTIYANNHQQKATTVKAQYHILHSTVKDPQSATSSTGQAKEGGTSGSQLAQEVSNIEQMLQEAVMGKETKSNAHAALKYVTARHKECLNIEHGLLELKQLSDMLAILVEAQSHITEDITVHIMAAKEDIKAGLSKVRKAR